MARLSTAPLCVNPGCAIPRVHKTDCKRKDDERDPCRGCQPGQAAPGLRLCKVCIERFAENALTAGQLHTDLELQLRRQGRGERTSGTRDRSPMPDAAVMDCRYEIAYLLAGLVDLMVFERGFTAPNLRGYFRKAPAKPSPYDQKAAKGDIGGRERTASEVEVMAAYVAKHAEWFASHPDAGKHADKLHTATHGRVWSLAYPSGPARIYIGQCPLIVTIILEDDAGKQTLTEGPCDERLDWDGQAALITCPGCETAETVEWWQRQIVGETGGVVDAQTGAAWLSLHWFRDVRPSVLANWASRDKLPRLMAEPEREGAEPKPLKDGRGRTLFRLEDVKACAIKTWGPQPPVEPRRKANA